MLLTRVTQRMGDIQRMSLNEFWGHCIDGRTAVQDSPTALIIDSDLGYFLRSTPMSEWIWVQEGSFPGHPDAQGASSKDACWAATGFWGAWPPFFVIPSFTFKLTFWVVFWRSFRKSLMIWSGQPHLKQFWFFFLYNLTTLAKWTLYPTDWSAPPTLLEVSMSSPAEDAASSSPYGFLPESSSALLFSTVVDQAVKVWLPFSFREENKFQGVWEWVTFNPPTAVVFGSRGSLASALLTSGLLGVGQSSWCSAHHPLCGATFAGIRG